MYKKIKNGSFMNLIWFIICILPLCFILFSLNNEDNKTQFYQNDFDIVNENGNLYLYDYDNAYGDMSYDFINNNLSIEGDTDNPTFEFYLTVLENTQKDYWYYYIFKLPYKVSVYNLTVQTNQNGNFNYVFEISYDNNIYIDYVIIPFQYSFELNNDNYYSLKIVLQLENNDFANSDNLQFEIFANENYIEKEYFEGFPNEIIIQPLNYWYNNFKSNGFISNAFLNLSQFFGVNNVYMSLACYYIEYLLVIILLHLGFDVLYILPNVCHKFMEKIGGERD